jgi:hypothetical protein
MGRIVPNIPKATLTATPPARAGASLTSPLSPTALAIDLVAVLVFVAVGRVSHDDPLSLGGVLDTAWPFLIGVAGGLLGLLLTRWPAFSLMGGVMMVFKTVVLGLVIRYAIQGEGTPGSFCLVTAVVLTALMLGWRLVAARRLGAPAL